MGDPNYEGVVEHLTPATDLPFGMIRKDNGTTWIAQGNVKPVPATSRSLDVYADPSGREDEKRAALREVADAMETILSRQAPLREHTNRGLRALIIAQLGDGGEERYFDAFRRAGLGAMPDGRARVARLADLFPQRFERENRGLGSEIVRLVEDDGAAAPAPAAAAAAADPEDLFADFTDDEAPRPSSSSRPSGAPPAEPIGVDAIFGPPRPARPRAVGPGSRRVRPGPR